VTAVYTCHSGFYVQRLIVAVRGALKVDGLEAVSPFSGNTVVVLSSLFVPKVPVNQGYTIIQKQGE